MLLQRPARLSLQLWLAAGAGVLATVTSACGSRPAVQTPSAGGADLCQVTADVERLVVQRLGIYPVGFFSFPASVSVTNPTTAREIAAAVCALPVVPSGAIFHCPNDSGIIYSLRFIVNGGAKSIEADPTGCQGVWGQGFVARRTALSPGFWPTLGTAMGLPRPSRRTFVGICWPGCPANGGRVGFRSAVTSLG